LPPDWHELSIDPPVKKQAADPLTREVAAMPPQPQKSRWSVEIYEVVDHDHQQRILEVFLEIARPQVVALGTHSGRNAYVIVEVSSAADRIFARRTISAIDTHARRMYTSSRTGVSGPLPA
jgi:hypothetical protein